MLVPSHRCTPSRTRTDTVSSSEAEGPSRCSSRRRPTSDFALDAEAEPRRRPTPERGELSSLTARVQMGAAQSRKPRGGLRRWKPPPFTAHLQKPSLLSHFLRTSEARDAFAKLLVRIDFKKGEQLPDAAVLYLESGELVRQVFPSRSSTPARAVNVHCGQWILVPSALSASSWEPSRYPWASAAAKPHRSKSGHRAPSRSNTTEWALDEGGTATDASGLRKILKLASSVYGGSATDSSARKEPSFDGASPDASAPSRRQPSRARTSQREGSGRREMTRRNSVSRFLSRGAKREPGPAMELTVLLAITDGLAYYLPNRALIKYVSHSQESFLAIKSFVHLRNFFGELSCLSQPPSTSACQAVCDYCSFHALAEREIVYDAGQRSEYLYFLLSGRVSVELPALSVNDLLGSRRSFVDGVEGKSSHVLIRPGQYFGAEPLMLDWSYTGSAVVSSDAIVAIVRRRHLADIWTVLPQLKSAMEAQLKIQILEGYRMAKLPYFALLSDAQLKQAANACEIDLNVPPNKLVIQKGSKLDALHIVVDGEVGAIGRHASSTNNSSCDLRAQVSASSVLGASTRESEDGYITPSRLPQPLEKKLTLRNRLSFNEVQRHSCDHEGGKRTSRKTSVESSLSMMRGLSSGILFGSKMTGRRSSKKTFSETDDSKREIAERAEALSYQLGNVHWKVQPGEWLGELAVLFDDCCKAAATYTVEETGCVMLRFPRDAFITLFDDDRSIISELRVKLLRADCGLEDILGSPRAQPVFFAFLEEQSRGLSYGLKFYEAAHKYAKLEQLSFPAAKRVVSQSIRFEFFDLRSPHACRIPAERLELIDQAMALGNPVAELFLVEARAWFSVFREEYLPRFVNDPLFWSLLEEIGSYKADLVNVALLIQETVSTVSVSRHTSEDTSRNAGRSGDQPGSSDPILDERMMKRLTIDSKGVGRVSLLSA